ncbi:MAG: CbiM family transporter [Gemmataceae bacterium]
MLALTSGLWAVHIADGVLSWPVLATGFVVAGLLALIAGWRVHEDEIPRIAILTAAFFLASSIHVRIGPTSVHLLLSGLVGVVLGLRAPLAILIGVTLQALLLNHGGLTTVGVNAATEMLPALGAAIACPVLLRLTRGAESWRRAGLVLASGLVWGACLALGVAVLLTNPVGEMVRVSPGAGLILTVDNLTPALRLLTHPVTVGGVLVFALVGLWLERRATLAAEFPAGALVGMAAVVGTTLLTGLVLIADGADRWSTFATVVFLAHLPLALLEGLILGMTVGFLARVKPAMLRLPTVEPAAEYVAVPLAEQSVPVVLLAIGALLVTSGPLSAHALEITPKVDRQAKKVTVVTAFEAEDPPKNARAKVVRDNGTVLTEGPLDEKGIYTFAYERPEPLRVVVTAPGGHRASVTLTAADLGEAPAIRAGGDAPAPEPRSRGHDIFLGLTFLIALTALALSWRNSKRLDALREEKKSA